MKIKEVRHLDNSRVRELCIRKNYYTCGDCEAYNHLLNDLCKWDKNATADDIYAVAEDILDHSDLEEISCGNSREDVLMNIMFEVANECCHTTYEQVEERKIELINPRRRRPIETYKVVEYGTRRVLETVESNAGYSDTRIFLTRKYKGQRVFVLSCE